MDKKKIIQIIIVIAAFCGSGLVLYNGFFKNSAPAPATISALPGQEGGAAMLPGGTADLGGGAQIGGQAILPDGNNLNFDVLKKQDLQPNNISYPHFQPGNGSIGIPEQNLIVPSTSSSGS